MKEKGILFNNDMVKSILDGSKSQTRRLNGLHEINKNPDEWTLQSFEMNPELMMWDKNDNSYPKVMKGLIATFRNNEYGEYFVNVKCPYEIGMTLWVRETYTRIGFGYEFETIYKADDMNLSMVGDFKWKPSIHMRRNYARLFLTVKDRRVERLQDITEDDAIAEGVSLEMAFEHNGWTPTYNNPDNSGMPDYKEGFKYLWDRINLKRECGWNTNCWVWKIGFEVVK